MASTITRPHSPNSTKPAPPRRPRPGRDDQPPLRVARPAAAVRVEERRLTAEGLAGLEAAGLTRFAGQRAITSVEQRTTLRSDPQLFLEAAGAGGYAALTVSVTAARRFLGADDLAAISEATTTPMLRVEPIKAAPARTA